jgi:DNA invertase Pin-like site-specific DNA recombinase
MSKPFGFAYVRWSTPEQSKGNSYHRQMTAVAKWCESHGVQLDETQTMFDRGVSAYSGANLSEEAALGQFVLAVQDGRIPHGSYFICENLDRLSRRVPRKGLRLWMDLLDAGVSIVQLVPEKVFKHDSEESMDLFLAVMEFGRGHSESRMKSVRGNASREKSLVRAREKGRFVPGNRPAWVRVEEDEVVLIPERAEAIQKIFQLARDGYGIVLIVRKMIEEGVPAFGDRQQAKDEDGLPIPVVIKGQARKKLAKNGSHYGSGTWTNSYVRKLLGDRRVLGEFQPKDQHGNLQGDPICFPELRVIEEADFHAVQGALAGRKRNVVRTQKYTSPLGGLLRHALDDDTFFVSQHRGKHYFLNTKGAEGKAPFVRFPADVLETAVLSFLQEIEPRDVLEGANGHSEVNQLQQEKDGLQAELDKLGALIETNDDVEPLIRKYKARKARLAEVKDKLARAAHAAANPLSATWAEVKQALLARAKTEDGRIKLGALLKKIIVRIDLLVPKSGGRDRLAYLLVHFKARHAEGHFRVRAYWICYRPALVNPRRSKPAVWRAESQGAEGHPAMLEMVEEGQGWDGNLLERAAGGLLSWHEEVKDQEEGWTPI